MEPPQHFDPGRHRRLTGGLVSSDSPGAGGQPLEACPGRGGGSQAAVEAATSHEARNSGMDRCFFLRGSWWGWSGNANSFLGKDVDVLYVMGT